MSLLDREEARKKTARLRDQEGRTVVFTNGCFDLLHRGHLHLLEEAARQGDYLIVGLNTDDSVRTLKGEGRPVQPEQDRAALLDAVEWVDDVVLFSERTPESLIEALKPDVLVKGADYAPDEVVGASFVKQRGGRLHRVELLDGKATSDIIRRIRGGAEGPDDVKPPEIEKGDEAPGGAESPSSEEV